MDIHCPTCGEPWEAHHMLHDEPHEWDLSSSEADAVTESGQVGAPGSKARTAAEAAGWVFAGGSVLAFIGCPCCKKRPVLRDAQQRRVGVDVIASMLEDDPDALACMLEDMPAMLQLPD